LKFEHLREFKHNKYFHDPVIEGPRVESFDEKQFIVLTSHFSFPYEETLYNSLMGRVVAFKSLASLLVRAKNGVQPGKPHLCRICLIYPEKYNIYYLMLSLATGQLRLSPEPFIWASFWVELWLPFLLRKF
jgi:hypothetical protein